MIYEVPDNVAYIDCADVEGLEALYLTVLPYGRTVRLEGISRRIWIIAADGHKVMAGLTDVNGDPTAAAADVASFLEDLVALGVLTVRLEGPARPGS
jgi:hypothetical protein